MVTHTCTLAMRRGRAIVYDISNLSAPAHVSTTSIGRWVYGIRLSGTLAYVANYWDGFKCIGLRTDPANPIILTQVYGPRPVWDLQLADTTLYLLRCDYGVVAYDVSNPTMPQENGSLSLPDGTNGWKPPMDMELVGDYAFVSQGTQGVFVIDVRDPGAMTVLKQYPTDDFAWGLDREGSTLYVGQWKKGIMALDITPYLPVPDIGAGAAFTVPLSKPYGQSYGVALSDDLVLVAAGTEI